MRSFSLSQRVASVLPRVEHLNSILDAGCAAPKPLGFRLSSIIVATEKPLRARMAGVLGDPRIEEAPVVLILLADYAKVFEACRLLRIECGEPSLAHLLVALFDAVLAASWMLLRAWELGYGSCMSLLVRRCKTLSSLLSLPPRTAPLVGVCIGGYGELRRERLLGRETCVYKLPVSPRSAAEALASRMGPHRLAPWLTLLASLGEAGENLLECLQRLGWRV